MVFQMSDIIQTMSDIILIISDFVFLLCCMGKTGGGNWAGMAWGAAFSRGFFIPFVLFSIAWALLRMWI